MKREIQKCKNIKGNKKEKGSKIVRIRKAIKKQDEALDKISLNGVYKKGLLVAELSTLVFMAIKMGYKLLRKGF